VMAGVNKSLLTNPYPNKARFTHSALIFPPIVLIALKVNSA